MKKKLFLSMFLCGLLASVAGAATSEAEDQDQEVAVKDLPAAVARTAMRVFPNGEIKKAEKEMEDGQAVFELEVAVEDKMYEIEMTAKGSLIKVVLDDDEDGDEDGDKEAEEGEHEEGEHEDN